MRYKNTIEAIRLQLDELQKNIAYWEVSEELRHIDIDTGLHKLRDIYDLLLSIKEDNDLILPTPVKENQPIELEPEIKIKTVVDQTSEPPAESKHTEPKTKKEETIEIIKKSVLEPQTEYATDKTKEKKDTANSEKKSLGDSISGMHPTLNEELSTKVKSADLARHLKNRPITDLSTAIGLNEKFELINNLFNGDRNSYNETIERLNLATNFNEAYNYLSDKLNWDMDNPMVQRLLDLIRRKLIVKKS